MKVAFEKNLITCGAISTVYCRSCTDNWRWCAQKPRRAYLGSRKLGGQNCNSTTSGW